MYDPWSIKVDGFVNCKSDAERLSYLVCYASLAPSTHNSQPWKFLISKNKIYLKPEMSRWLRYSDPSGRQMWLSIGCALENLCIAADFFGYKTHVEFHEDRNLVQIYLERELAGRFDDQHLIFSIPRRTTNRSHHLMEKINYSFLKNLSGDDRVSVKFFDSDEDMEKFAKSTASGTINAFNNKKFRTELSGYLKNNFTGSRVGMPLYGMEMPDTVSLIAPLVSRFLNMGNVFANKIVKLFDTGTSGVVAFGTVADDKKSWFDVGRVFERSALFATQSGYCLSPLAAAVEYDDRLMSHNIFDDLAIKLQMMARVGRPSRYIKHSPRLSLKEICTIDD